MAWGIGALALLGEVIAGVWVTRLWRMLRDRRISISDRKINQILDNLVIGVGFDRLSPRQPLLQTGSAHANRSSKGAGSIIQVLFDLPMSKVDSAVRQIINRFCDYFLTVSS